MKYNKLVRDKIPEYIKNKGEVPVIHIADNEEYWEKLKEKLLEEIKEFSENEVIEEMADIQEVIDAMCDYKNFNKESIEVVRKKKSKERGHLKKRLFWKNHRPRGRLLKTKGYYIGNKMTEKDILDLIKRDKWMMDVLRVAEKLNLPDWIIGAGFIRNKV